MVTKRKDIWPQLRPAKAAQVRSFKSPYDAAPLRTRCCILAAAVLAKGSAKRGFAEESLQNFAA